MREIEFRGKRTNGGEWAYGFLDHTYDRYTIHSHGAHYCYEVHPETVGQYTGLKDRNGVKIFEGDVIEDSYGNIGVIDYSCHFVQWRIIFRKGREDLIDKYGAGCSIFDWISQDNFAGHREYP